MKKNGIGRENGSDWMTQEQGLHPKTLRNHRSPEPAICCANKCLFASVLVVRGADLLALGHVGHLLVIGVVGQPCVIAVVLGLALEHENFGPA